MCFYNNINYYSLSFKFCLTLINIIFNINCIFFFYREQFESEFETFMDGIVNATFEYVCQFIIKNSLENIKRTQNALSSSSLNSKYH